MLAVLSPPTLHNVETRKKFWIHASNALCCLSMIVGRKKERLSQRGLQARYTLKNFKYQYHHIIKS